MKAFSSHFRVVAQIGLFTPVLWGDLVDTDITANLALTSTGTLSVAGESSFDGQVAIYDYTIWDDDAFAPWSPFTPPTDSYWNVLLEDGFFITGNSGYSLGLDFDTDSRIMFWYPFKSAFRSVVTSDTSTDEAQIGEGSIAIGMYPQASNTNAIAFGNGVVAGSLSAISIGTATHTGSISIGAGGTGANGSFNVGFYNNPIGGVVSVGSNNLCVNNNKPQNGVTLGNDNQIAQWGAMAIGNSCESTGIASLALGYHAIANSYSMIAIGAYNLPASGQTFNSWIETDQLFVLGNGQDDASRSNALVIYKNADVELYGEMQANGRIKVQSAGGDISMGSYGE